MAFHVLESIVRHREDHIIILTTGNTSKIGIKAMQKLVIKANCTSNEYHYRQKQPPCYRALFHTFAQETCFFFQIIHFCQDNNY